MYQFTNSNTIIYNKKYYDNVCKINVYDISLYVATKRKFFNLIKTNNFSFNINTGYLLQVYLQSYMYNKWTLLPKLMDDDYIVYTYYQNKLYIGNELKNFIEMYRTMSILTT